MSPNLDAMSVIEKNENNDKQVNFTSDYTLHTNKISNKITRIKMDSACSHNMSGISGRIKNIRMSDKRVEGFNGMMSRANLEGENEDKKMELYIEDMPTDLVLLSAKAYADDGAVVLLPDYGLHLYMDENERLEFESFIGK